MTNPHQPPAPAPDKSRDAPSADATTALQLDPADASLFSEGPGSVMPTAGERLAWSIPETAMALGIGRTAAYAAAARGEIPTVRVGRRALVPKAALEAMLAGAIG